MCFSRTFIQILSSSWMERGLNFCCGKNVDFGWGGNQFFLDPKSAGYYI
jgi:hypothetical protein